MATRTPSGATRSWLTTPGGRSPSGTAEPLGELMGRTIQTPAGPATHSSSLASQLTDVKRVPLGFHRDSRAFARSCP